MQVWKLLLTSMSRWRKLGTENKRVSGGVLMMCLHQTRTRTEANQQKLKKMLHAAQERQKNYQNCSRCWWKVKVYCNSTPATGSTLLLLLLAVTGKYLIVSKNPPVTVLVWITQGFMFGVNTPFGTPSLWHHEDWRVLKTKKKLRNWAFWSPSLWLTRITDLQFSDTWQKIKKSILDQLSH